jgi:hypothetical protein
MKITRSTEVRRSEWRLAAMLMHVPNVRLLDTGLDEAKWKIGLAWPGAKPIHWTRSLTTLFVWYVSLGVMQRLERSSRRGILLD